MAIHIRAKSLNEEYPLKCNSNNIKCFKQKFDIDEAQRLLLVNANAMILECENIDSADRILEVIYKNIDTILESTKHVRENSSVVYNNIIKECDILFKKYLLILNNNQFKQSDIVESYRVYQLKRNELSQSLIKSCNLAYKYAIETHDAKKVWKMIDWSGNAHIVAPKNHPSIDELSEHFTNLYEPIDDEDNLETLVSNVTIPITDDPISSVEVQVASHQMKKGGYDYPISVLKILLSTVMSIILLLLNTILFNVYPSKLCVSLLSVIPKSGNLSLPTNYRGIQMQPLLANLYDRVLANRLIQWVKINDEQTAFQKGKGTIDQIFILRVIIALMKYNKCNLYIGFFDLSKAFDRVSRLLLLKALVKMGVGTVMLNALKCIYSTTRCILKGYGKISQIFETYTGIKQGASSSVILFIAFLDDIIDILKEKCVIEPLLHKLHCLLHADDTLIMSTKRDLFIIKCNILITAIHEKNMSLNYKKSGYMIISDKCDDIKCDLKLEDGWLNYKRSQKYLGIIITDSGNIKNDVSAFTDDKNKHVNIKLANFIKKNMYAPIMIKLKVVNACVNSALTYGCEAWSSCPLNSIEVLQRKALKIALNIQSNTPNEIIYIETGFKPLKTTIYKRQLKFFRKFKNECLNNHDSTISLIFQQAMDANVPFIKHYKKLDETFINIDDCYNFYVKEHENNIAEKIRLKKTNDENSILATYYRINPLLKSPDFYHQLLCMESERLVITRYRTGSHTLRIQTGRWKNELRNERLCECKTDIQTIDHMLFKCPITENIRQIYQYGNLDLTSFFQSNDYVNISVILKSIELVK